MQGDDFGGCNGENHFVRSVRRTCSVSSAGMETYSTIRKADSKQLADAAGVGGHPMYYGSATGPHQGIHPPKEAQA